MGSYAIVCIERVAQVSRWIGYEKPVSHSE